MLLSTSILQHMIRSSLLPLQVLNQSHCCLLTQNDLPLVSNLSGLFPSIYIFLSFPSFTFHSFLPCNPVFLSMDPSCVSSFPVFSGMFLFPPLSRSSGAKPQMKMFLSLCSSLYMVTQAQLCVPPSLSLQRIFQCSRASIADPAPPQ